MESMAAYYLQMFLSYLAITLQCFVYLGVGILAFRVAGPAVRALKAYTASRREAAAPAEPASAIPALAEEPAAVEPVEPAAE